MACGKGRAGTQALKGPRGLSVRTARLPACLPAGVRPQPSPALPSLPRARAPQVREMYAWDVAVFLANVSLVHRLPPDSRLMAQPPADHRLGAAAIYHYTWGSIFKEDGKEVWRFDKRDYTKAEEALKVSSVARWGSGARCGSSCALGIAPRPAARAGGGVEDAA